MTQVTRREAILAAGLAGAGTLLGPGRAAGTTGDGGLAVRKGHLKQARCFGCCFRHDKKRGIIHGMDAV